MCRRAYARCAPNVDILLLSPDGQTVYNGPLRLAVPYFLSVGLGSLGRECSEAALLDIVSSAEASTPLLAGQVRGKVGPLVDLFHPLSTSSVRQDTGPLLPLSDIPQSRFQTDAWQRLQQLLCPQKSM